jgi:hypothetical protein
MEFHFTSLPEMKFFFHKDAEAEFDSAIDYYEQSKLGLGSEFAEEVSAAITRINEYSEAWPVMSSGITRHMSSRRRTIAGCIRSRSTKYCNE